ncbi:tetratricopeptide repeat-containing protein [Cystoisospora suis]|uniref:Tetratricopeptide repeat-containing protein n=1 Tax=Cystoisospora suis TaxID=483139 RepID=A0A2C6KNR8_9APIC|nr:tetratricopeptide repeat-containing protein [Cystoisospora suis]
MSFLAGEYLRPFFGVNNVSGQTLHEVGTAAVGTDQVDVAEEALHFSVNTRNIRSPFPAYRLGKEKAYQGDVKEGEQGTEEKRLQKVVDKQELDGDAVLPLAELLDVCKLEARPRPVRVDLSVKGRMTGAQSEYVFSASSRGHRCSACSPACPASCRRGTEVSDSGNRGGGRGPEAQEREAVLPQLSLRTSCTPSPSQLLFSPSSRECSSFPPASPGSGDELRDAFLLEGVLSSKECEWLWTRVENGPGFTYWDSTHTASETYRSAYTVEIFHPVLADLIWERIKDLVIPEVTIDENDEERAERDLVGDWIACGVNPHMLFARYTDGAHFGPHTDGCTAVDFNTRTLWPAVLYLNDVEDGGETLVIADGQKTSPMIQDDKGRHTADPRWVVDAVEARAGRMLFFYHTQMHEGRRVGPGSTKYIIRTDIFYRRKTPMLTSPKDREAFVLWQRAQLLAEEGSTDDAAVLFRRSVKLSPGLAAVYGMA